MSGSTVEAAAREGMSVEEYREFIKGLNARGGEVLANLEAVHVSGPSADEVSRQVQRPQGDGTGRGTPTGWTPDTDTDDECMSKAAAWLAGLPEKVTVGQVTRRPARAAALWLARYQGDFEFLVDLKRRGRNLSPAQAKGVLNCWRADLRRSAAQSSHTSPSATEGGSSAGGDGYEAKRGDVHVVGGTYYRIHVAQQSGRPYAARADICGAAQWAEDGKLVSSADIRWEYDRGMIFKLSEATRATAEEAAAFGHLVGRCCFCSHEIDTPESTAVGYGPVCAAKYELPWGE